MFTGTKRDKEIFKQLVTGKSVIMELHMTHYVVIVDGCRYETVNDVEYYHIVIDYAL